MIITNWDTSILSYVNKDAKKYTVLHTDYSNETEKKGMPRDREDITYIGITESSKKAFEDITGIDRTILCRNPLEIGKEEKPLILVSATRLTKIKDDGRLAELAEELDRQKIKYIWYIITTDEYKANPVWANKNVIHIPNRLDISYFMETADWYVQLSTCEGDSYSLKEALYRGTPIVVCELPYFKEIGIENNVNALFYNSDNSNKADIAKKMKKPLKFTFEKVKDGYDKILKKSKSRYEEEKEMRFLVEATDKYTTERISDNELSEIKGISKYKPKKGEQWEVDFARKELLETNGFVKVIKEIKEKADIKETIKEDKKEERPIRRRIRKD